MTLSLFGFDQDGFALLSKTDGENLQNCAKDLFESPTSILFLNNQLPNDRKIQIWRELQRFITKNSLFESPSFLIPTSGTTSSDLKVVVIKKENFLKAADKANLFLKATMKDSWLVSLPLHHVGGLSILARSFLKNSGVFYYSKWQPDTFIKTIQDHTIAYCSLVPTQIFDLVNNGVHAPASLKRVLVGGSVLSENRFTLMQNLGWPLVKTFGMTETSAFISTSSGGDRYEPLPGVNVSLDAADHLAIRCDSLFEGYLFQRRDLWDFKPKDVKKGFWSTEDRALIFDLDATSLKSFKLLGRDQTMIKINGELVNVNLLNERLGDLVQTSGLPLNSLWIHFVPNDRAENELLAIFTGPQSEATPKKVIQKFNQLVLPFERVHWYLKVPEISTTELGKVKLGVFNSASFKENYFENRKNILD